MQASNAQVDIFGAIVGTVSAVFSVIAAIPTGRSSLLAAAPAIAMLTKSIGSVAQIGTEIFLPENKRTELNKFQESEKGLSDHIKEVAEAAKTVISFTKTLDELWSAKSIGPSIRNSLSQQRRQRTRRCSLNYVFFNRSLVPRPL